MRQCMRKPVVALAAITLATATSASAEPFSAFHSSRCSNINGRTRARPTSPCLPSHGRRFPLLRPSDDASRRRSRCPRRSAPLSGNAAANVVDVEEQSADETAAALVGGVGVGGGGTATVPGLTVSLVKAIVGSGVLALPAGVAALGDDPSSVALPAAVLIALAGLMSAYFFVLLGRVCQLTGAESYREAWELSVGERGSDLVAVTVAAKTALSCLAFSMVLADSFQALFVAAGFADMTRTGALLAVTVSALLPLCLLKDLKSLSTFSALGLSGMAFTMCTMAVRYFDGTYDPGVGGVFLSDTADTFQPSFGDAGPLPQGGLVLLCLLATANVAHYNAPRFYSELRDPTPKRFGAVVGSAYAVAAATSAAVALLGFLTFGVNSSGLILNNYAGTDPLATLSRAAVALSVVCTYPIAFLGFRDGALSLLGPRALLTDEECSIIGARDEWCGINVNALSAALLGGVTVLAANVHDLGIVLAVGGGTFSTAVAAVFPALMYSAAVDRMGEEASEVDVLAAKVGVGLMWVGIAVGLAGVASALG